ncbi:hypothetical protein [Mesorhizobium sp. M0676]
MELYARWLQLGSHPEYGIVDLVVVALVRDRQHEMFYPLVLPVVAQIVSELLDPRSQLAPAYVRVAFGRDDNERLRVEIEAFHVDAVLGDTAFPL